METVHLSIGNGILFILILGDGIYTFLGEGLETQTKMVKHI